MFSLGIHFSRMWTVQMRFTGSATLNCTSSHLSLFLYVCQPPSDLWLQTSLSLLCSWKLIISINVCFFSSSIPLTLQWHSMTGRGCRRFGHTHILWDSWDAGPISRRRVMDAGTHREKGVWLPWRVSLYKKKKERKPQTRSWGTAWAELETKGTQIRSVTATGIG